jgi:hypothetical protein
VFCAEKCAPVCPTNAILEINFPPKKERAPKVEKKEEVTEKTVSENTSLVDLAKKNNDSDKEENK